MPNDSTLNVAEKAALLTKIAKLKPSYEYFYKKQYASSCLHRSLCLCLLVLFQAAPQVAHADLWCTTTAGEFAPYWGYPSYPSYADQVGGNPATLVYYGYGPMWIYPDCYNYDTTDEATMSDYDQNIQQEVDNAIWQEEQYDFGGDASAQEAPYWYWYDITALSVPPPTVSLSVSSNSVPNGTAVLLSWNSTNASSCYNNFGGGGGGSGAIWVTPPSNASTDYYEICDNINGEGRADQGVTAYTQLQPDLTVGSAPTVTVTLGQSIPLSGTVINQGNASTGSGFDNIFLTNLNAQGTAWNTIQDSGTAPALGPYGASEGIGITLPASTFSSRQVRDLYAYCANFNASWATSVAESNYNNNCVVGTIVVNAPPPPSVSFSGNPTTITQGNSSTLLMVVV